MSNADEIRKLLKLEPHPKEGGYFVQTYKSGHTLPPDVLPPGYPSERFIGTAIHYLLGTDIALGMRPQIIVLGGVWQGSRLRAGGEFALMGNTMSPGCEDQDYETGS